MPAPKISKINGLEIIAFEAQSAQYVAAGNVDGPLGNNSVESAVSASYIDPTFISASAAASGFGSGGGGGPSTDISALNAFSGSMLTFTASIQSQVNALKTATSSYVLNSSTASFVTNSQTSSFVLNVQTSSMTVQTALTASSITSLTQNVTINGNLTVFGTASYTFLSASSLNVSNNTISVNVFEPQQRFGGLIVYDSGSSAATASLLWDSLNNRWVYQNASGSTYSGAMLINGPRNSGALGEEQGTTNNALMKGQGGDHITSSRIFDDGTNVYTTSDVQITGSLTVTGNVIATSSWATNAVSASYSTTLGANLLQPTAGILRLRSSNGTVLTELSALSAANSSTASYVNGNTFTSANPALSASYALTASYALSSAGVAGGVTSITAGTGISVNQSTGAVTISATGGSGGVTNLGLVYAVSLGYLMP